MIIKGKHLCSICDRNYSSRQSLYNHRKRIHSVEKVSLTPNSTFFPQFPHKIKQELTDQFMKMLGDTHLHTQHIGNQLNDNATQNNITIVSPGNEDVLGTLTQQEKLHILNERYKSVSELVKNRIGVYYSFS